MLIVLFSFVYVKDKVCIVNTLMCCRMLCFDYNWYIPCQVVVVVVVVDLLVPQLELAITMEVDMVALLVAIQV